MSPYFYEILPKKENGQINFDQNDGQVDYLGVVDETGNPVWQKVSNPLRNLRKSFTNHYLRCHWVVDIPWCLQTTQQRLQSQSFFAALKESSASSESSVSSEPAESSEYAESSDSSDASESSAISESSDSTS